MKHLSPTLPLLLLLLCGCLSQSELIQKRIRQKQVAFDAYPAETQQRLGEGIVLVGDSEDMVWIAFGPPSRKYTRILEGGTNTLWSYADYETRYSSIPQSTVVYYVHPRHGLVPAFGTRWASTSETTIVERRRVEFKGDAVFAIELMESTP